MDAGADVQGTTEVRKEPAVDQAPLYKKTEGEGHTFPLLMNGVG
jgi:hypothetical protein